jgi:ElaB/YqjD/DUF883 family membrane-anchored ribosome-binding protein
MSEQRTEESWREVGDQFRALGESLSRAFRTAWESEENRQHLQGVKSGLKAMVDQINQAIEDAGTSPEGQKVRQEAERAVESARAAGEKALQEARPHVLSAVRQINAEMERWAGKMEERGPGAEERPAEPAPDQP